MAVAFKVKYEHNSRACPDCIMVFETVDQVGPTDSMTECVGELAIKIKERLVSARGGNWEARNVTIRSIEYLGPWFMYVGIRGPGAAVVRKLD